MKDKKAIPSDGLFPVVGLGACVGGLVVLEQFLSDVPANSRMAVLLRASNDMRNLLESTGIAPLFPDVGLNVRRFTAQTVRVNKLIPGDMGRPISDVVTDLVYPEMAQAAQAQCQALKEIAKLQGVGHGLS